MTNQIFSTKSILFLVLFFLIMPLSIKKSKAVLTCQVSNLRTDTLTLSPINISAGPDLPVGSIIYRGTWNDKDFLNDLKCTSDVGNGDSADVIYRLGIASAPYPLSTLSIPGQSGYSGKAYTTNVPGIGAVIVDYTYGYPATHLEDQTMGRFTLQMNSQGPQYFGHAKKFDLILIKIGPTPPGGYTLNASSLPSAKVFGVASVISKLKGLPADTRKIVFNGSLRVNAQTCTTPDVNVELGSHNMSAYPKVGDASPWVPFNIRLTNCPVFYGNFPGSNPVNLTSGSSVTPTPTSNKIGVSLTPNSSILDVEKGIMALSTEIGAATGFGIQVARYSISPQIISFADEFKVDLPRTGVATWNVPMSARYIRTELKGEPGKANGKLTFTINYY
ncbi:fimbrial protein (plasmid) [Enterobacter kobei]|uniref:fimbrial protein n=1 Tax=Enterobacter kobei TaxID=208224 RepID=UPI0032AF5A2E|nr:type 1 fimbrial protein [Enterobacter kobei]